MANVIDYVELAVDDLDRRRRPSTRRPLGWAFNEYGDDYAGIRDPSDPDRESAA